MFRTVTINREGVANGFEVQVGCQRFVFEMSNLGKFTDLLARYIRNPEEVEQELAKEFPQTVGRATGGMVEAPRELQVSQTGLLGSIGQGLTVAQALYPVDADSLEYRRGLQAGREAATREYAEARHRAADASVGGSQGVRGRY